VPKHNFRSKNRTSDRKMKLKMLVLALALAYAAHAATVTVHNSFDWFYQCDSSCKSFPMQETYAVEPNWDSKGRNVQSATKFFSFHFNLNGLDLGMIESAQLYITANATRTSRDKQVIRLRQLSNMVMDYREPLVLIADLEVKNESMTTYGPIDVTNNLSSDSNSFTIGVEAYASHVSLRGALNHLGSAITLEFQTKNGYKWNPPARVCYDHIPSDFIISPELSFKSFNPKIC
jgi:hypothetical protein